MAPRGSARPIELFSEERQAAAEKRVPLFTIDGVEYSMPAEPPAFVVLAYLKTVREKGDDVAAYELLENMLGEEAYEALRNCKTATVSDLAAITRIVGEHSVGAIAAGRGNSRGARRK